MSSRQAVGQDSSTNLIRSLQTVLQKLQEQGKTTAKSLPALFYDLTGSNVAAQMAVRLLEWTPYSKQSDGSVYKSLNDWWEELRLTKDQVSRVHQRKLLEKLGIETKLRKVRGAPTKHYRAALNQLLQSIATFFEVALSEVMGWISGKPENEPDGKLNNPDFRESGKTYNNVTPNSNEQQKESVPLKGEIPVVNGLGQKELQRYLRKHGAETVQHVIAYTLQQTTVHTPLAFIRKQMKRGYINRSEFPLQTIIEQPTRQVIQQPTASERPQRQITDNARKLEREWRVAMQQIELQLDRGSFDTWVRGTELIDYASDTMVIRARHEYARQQCQHRLYPFLRRIFNDVLECEGLRLEFVV
jgi:hypothetical protein